MTGLHTGLVGALHRTVAAWELVMTVSRLQRLLMLVTVVLGVATCGLIVMSRSHMCACGGGGPLVVP